MAEATDQPRFLQSIVKRLRSTWIVVPVAAVLFVTIPIFAFRFSQLRGVPDIGHPFDVEAFGTVDIDPADNAKTDYEEAVRLLNLTAEPESDGLDRVLGGTWADETPEARRWLNDNEEILKLWREGTKKGHLLIEQPKDLTGWNTMASASEMLSISRLSRMAASQAEEEGRFNEAWQWHLALFRYSRHLGMHSTSISQFLGRSCHSKAVTGIIRWADSESVTAEQLSLALEEIREGDQLTILLASRIRNHYFAILNEINRIDEMRDAYKQVMGHDRLNAAKEIMSDRFGINFNNDRFPSSIEMFFENDPELTQRLLQHQVANLLAFVDLPLSERPTLVEGDVVYFDAVSKEGEFMSPTDFLKAVNRSQYARLIFLKTGDGAESVFRERARQAMLEVILAAEWYRRVHGSFPESLEELVAAEMLPGIPIDPMSPSGSFIGFERDPDDPQHAKVWSAGRNKIDDRGSLDNPHPYHVEDYGFKIGGIDKQPE